MGKKRKSKKKVRKLGNTKTQTKCVCCKHLRYVGREITCANGGALYKPGCDDFAEMFVDPT